MKPIFSHKIATASCYPKKKTGILLFNKQQVSQGYLELPLEKKEEIKKET